MALELKTVAIVQARMGSSRLPGKVLAEISGQPLMRMLLTRLSRANFLDQIIVATTDNRIDDPLCLWLEKEGVDYFRGSETDVLSRFVRCAESNKADVIVRITADDPLKDPEIVDRAVKLYRNLQDVDYVSNTVMPTYPEGLDVEVFSRSSLELADKRAALLSEREHVTPYIWSNPDRFKIFNFEMKPDLSSWRWTVDKTEDLEFIRRLMGLAGNNTLVGYKKLIQIVLHNPDLLTINSGIDRNEGYHNSIIEERNKEKFVE